MGIAKNRIVSINGRDYTQVKKLEISDEGLVVHLKNFGQVKVFCRKFKNEDNRHYIMYLPDENALLTITRAEFLLYYVQSIGVSSATTEQSSKCVVLSDLW